MTIKHWAAFGLAVTMTAGMAQGQLVYDKLSEIEIWETITDIGGGQWLYEFEITQNNEADGIWFVFLYTEFSTTNASPFNKTGWSAADGSHLDNVFPVYDARNIEPDVEYMTGTWGPGPFGNSTNPIDPGELVDGFSFISNVFDPSPKLYGYELQGNYGAQSGFVSAIGYTIPSPAALTLLGLAGLATSRRRRN